MDPETLPVVASLNPRCLLVVPRAARGRALEIGLPGERVLGMADGERIEPLVGVAIEAMRSAHEVRKLNEQREDEFLGYVVRAGGIALYHSGDWVLHEGLVERLTGRGIDLALLPINGRNEHRRSNGVPGNFTFEEAVRLCKAAGIPSLLCHHYGMFNFNTADLGQARALLKRLHTPVQVLFAGIGVCQRVDATR